ncbi:restriction endonuclease subunit S [Aquiflexum sp.]|uniref:restriction endonuclease subunit S n=1 Tax=Aquiflexum sp. TaxID=1872584 RepID=UPI0035936BBF
MSFDKLTYQKGDALSLPKGWEIKKLGDVCTIKGRIGYRGYTKQDLVEKGYGAISLSPSNIQNNKFNSNECTYISWFKYEESPEIMVFNGDILFVKTGSTFGKVALVEDLPARATINPQFVVLKELKCSNRFLYYALTTNSFKKQVDGIIGGAATPTLSQTNLAELEVPIPPLPEQHSIIFILDEAFAAIAKAKANAEQNLKNAKELFESYLQGVFEKGDWETKTLNQISENLDSKRVPITKNIRKSGDIPYYGASGIVDHVEDYLFDEDLLCISEDGANLLARTYPIAFSISGKAWVNNHAHVLKFPNLTTQKFVETYINSIKIDDFVSGMAQPKLNQAMLNRIPIPFPPIAEQQTIVRRLDALRSETQKLEVLYQKKLDDLEELKKSILQKAFAGELKTEKEVVV